MGAAQRATEAIKGLAAETAKFREESKLLTEQLERQVGAAEAARLKVEQSLSAAERFNYQLNKMGEGVQGIALSIEQAGQALKGMATAVEQIQDSAHKGDEAVAEVLKKLDAIAAHGLDGGFINTVVNRWKEGLIDVDGGTKELKAQLDAVFQAMQIISVQGGGFMGDIMKQILDAQRALNALQGGIKDMQEGAGEMDWGGPGEGAGKQRAEGASTEAGVDGAAGFSDTAGSSSIGGNQSGPTSSGELTGFNDRPRGLVASAINLGPGGTTVAEQARILRELQRQIRMKRR